MKKSTLGEGSRWHGILFIDSPTKRAHAGLVELETVFKTLNAAEAQLIRSRLAAAGLDPEVDPEIDPLSVAGCEGIEIKVPVEQAGEARAILAASEGAEG